MSPIVSPLTDPAAIDLLQPDPPPAAPPQRHRPNPLLGVPIILALAAGAWFYWSSQPQPAVTRLHLSGRIEADETDIQAKNGGHVEAIAVHEGDTVRQGQVLAQISDTEIQAQLAQAAASITNAKEQQQRAQSRIAEIDAKLTEAQLTLEQSKGDSLGQINQATANVEAARAQVSQAEAGIDQGRAQVLQAQTQVQQGQSVVEQNEAIVQQNKAIVEQSQTKVSQAKAQLRQRQAELKLAKIDRDRYRDLRQQGVIAQQQLDQAQTKVETAQAAVETAQAEVSSAQAAVATAQATLTSTRALVNNARAALENTRANVQTVQASLAAKQSALAAAQDQLQMAQGNLTQAQTKSYNPSIRSAQIAQWQQQRQQAQADLNASQATVKGALAKQQEIQAQWAYLTLKSPITGIITERLVEPGAVVAPGKTLLTLIDPGATYLRGFIPEGDIGHVRVGQRAQVFLDSAPKQPLTARVIAIDPQASFTPENIYFQKDRVRQVFGIKLAIDDNRGLAKRGMPAEGTIDLSH